MLFQKKELSDAVSKLEKEQNVLEHEAKEMVAELGDPQHQKLTAGKYFIPSNKQRFTKKN